MKHLISQKKYTSIGNLYQLALPMDLGDIIPADDSVRLLNAVLERLDYRELHAAYSHRGRIGRSPETLFKIVVYGFMNRIYSSRDLEQACRRDINFMFLLGRTPAPDHATIARFCNQRLPQAAENLFSQLVRLLADAGELSLRTAFIDGTKFEACAGKYSFVWKKVLEKNQKKMQEKMKAELPKLVAQLGVRFRVGDRIHGKDLKKLRRRLYALKGDLEFVHGKGKRKHPLQKAIEQVDEYIARQKQYYDYSHSLGDRNSFSKTDRDATFMHMKDDHMRNGQLKPGYNVQVGVDSEYIVGVIISHERNDTGLFIPMMEKLKQLGYTMPVADAGYESEENYTYCEDNHLQAYIKPANHEQAKTKKYKSDIGRRENMPYDEGSDTYTCHAGHKLVAVEEKTVRTKSGYPVVKTIYSCAHCDGCPHKARCLNKNSNKPLEERSKNLEVSNKFRRQRKEMEARILTQEGIKLRINRSIQSEGAFGVLKQDMEFRRFLVRGRVKVETAFLILAMAYNINKLHNKIQANRCGTHLHIRKAS